MEEDAELMEFLQAVNPFTPVDDLVNFYRVAEGEDPLNFGQDDQRL